MVSNQSLHRVDEFIIILYRNLGEAWVIMVNGWRSINQKLTSIPDMNNVGQNITSCSCEPRL